MDKRTVKELLVEWGMVSEAKETNHAGYKIKLAHVHAQFSNRPMENPSENAHKRYDFTIHAHDNDGNKVGEATFKNLGYKYISAKKVFVEPEHRRKGIANAMYDHAERITQKTVKKSKDLTDDGKAFWKQDKAKRPFGK